MLKKKKPVPVVEKKAEKPKANLRLIKPRRIQTAEGWKRSLLNEKSKKSK